MAGKAPATSAWARGPPKISAGNGGAAAAAAPKPKAADAAAPSQRTAILLRDRFIHTLTKLVGKSVTARMSDGTQYEGVFHSAAPSATADDHKVAIRAARLVAGTAKDGFVPGSTALLQWRNVVHIACLSVDLRRDAPSAGSFSTDTDISGGANATGERRLQAVDASWVTGEVDGNMAGRAGKWDQFEANERLYGVKNTFDENLYTTRLDKGKFTETQMREAERLAREIEGKKSSNVHMAEERGHKIDDTVTEEERFSGVIRNGASQGAWRNGAPASLKAKPGAKPEVGAPPGLAKAKAPAPQATLAPAKAPAAPAAAAKPAAKAKPAAAAAAKPGKGAAKAAPAAAAPAAKPAEDAKAGEDAGKAKKSTKLSATAKEWTPSFGAPAPAPAAVPVVMPNPAMAVAAMRPQMAAGYPAAGGMMPRPAGMPAGAMQMPVMNMQVGGQAQNVYMPYAAMVPDQQAMMALASQMQNLNVAGNAGAAANAQAAAVAASGAKDATKSAADDADTKAAPAETAEQLKTATPAAAAAAAAAPASATPGAAAASPAAAPAAATAANPNMSASAAQLYAHSGMRAQAGVAPQMANAQGMPGGPMIMPQMQMHPGQAAAMHMMPGGAQAHLAQRPRVMSVGSPGINPGINPQLLSMGYPAAAMAPHGYGGYDALQMQQLNMAGAAMPMHAMHPGGQQMHYGAGRGRGRMRKGRGGRGGQMRPRMSGGGQPYPGGKPAIVKVGDPAAAAAAAPPAEAPAEAPAAAADGAS